VLFARPTGSWPTTTGWPNGCVSGRDVRGLSYEQMLRELAQRGEYAPADPEAAVARRLELVRAGQALSWASAMQSRRPYRIGDLQSAAGWRRVMTYTDVTEARDREARLEESEARFRYLFRHSPMPMWVYTLNGRQNPRGQRGCELRRTASSREEFLALTLFEPAPCPGRPSG